MSKNILIVTEFFPPVIKGGAAASVFSLAKTLHSTKNNVIVLATQSEDKEIVSDFKIYRTDYHEYYDYSKKGMPVIPSKILVHLFNINSFKNAMKVLIRSYPMIYKPGIKNRLYTK